MSKKHFLLIAIFFLGAFFHNAARCEEAQRRIVVDGKGREVAVPVTVTKVANLWNSANEIIVQLGAGEIFAGGSVHLRKRPWMTRIFPKALEMAVISQGGVANVESVLVLDPDFTFSIVNRADALIAIGEPVIQLDGSGGTLEGLIRQIAIIAEALGPEYQQQADRFFADFNANLDYVAAKTASIAEDEQKTVFHGTTKTTLSKASLTDDLLRQINARNAMGDTVSRSVSYEHILRADPDVIIVAGGRHGEYEKFLKDPIFCDVKAVKNGNVFLNPSGMFLWDAFSGEIALQVLWLAKTIYPEKFSDLDLNAKVGAFYRTYFNFAMSDKEIEYLLAGKGPDGQWQ